MPQATKRIFSFGTCFQEKKNTPMQNCDLPRSSAQTKTSAVSSACSGRAPDLIKASLATFVSAARGKKYFSPAKTASVVVEND